MIALMGAAKSEERCANQEAFLKEQQASLDKRKELSESSLTGEEAHSGCLQKHRHPYQGPDKALLKSQHSTTGRQYQKLCPSI